GRSGRDIKPVDRVDVIDKYTFMLHWKETSRFGDDLSFQEVSLLPKHILEAAFLEDTSTFLSHPWFSQPDQFVGAGPYRPVACARGSQLTVTAFDKYYQGPAKIE